MLMNVGGGSGAAAAPAAAPAAAAGGATEAAAPAAEEKKKEEGTSQFVYGQRNAQRTNTLFREGGVRRGHGLRSLRLSVSLTARWQEWCHGRGFALGRVQGYVTSSYASITTTECHMTRQLPLPTVIQTFVLDLIPRSCACGRRTPRHFASIHEGECGTGEHLLPYMPRFSQCWGASNRCACALLRSLTVSLPLEERSLQLSPRHATRACGYLQ